MSLVARILSRHRRAFAEWEQHVTDALDLFADEPHHAPEFDPPVLTVVDALFLRENGISHE